MDNSLFVKSSNASTTPESFSELTFEYMNQNGGGDLTLTEIFDTSNVVYKFSCSCASFYIGQS